MVELKNVTKRWGDAVAVDDQSLAVGEHEFLALLGPSGCGKTTALRMIAGLEAPTSGRIYIGGADATDLPPQARDVAMVFQNYGLYPHMTVAANIGYPLRVRKVAAADIGARVAAAAARVRIGDFLARKPRQLSGGQRQRVALARAIVRQPRLFLMDEPLSNLDAQLRGAMRAELQHLSRELRVTTVYVTHDQIEAMTLADRIAVMQGGRIRQLATPEEVHDAPADMFVAGFIGSPPMNLIPGALREGNFESAFGTVGGVGGGSLDAAVLGARPEDLAVVSGGQRADAAVGGGYGAGKVGSSGSGGGAGRVGSSGGDGGHFVAPVYACERTGEHTLLTVEAGGVRITAKGDRRLRFGIGERVCLRVNIDRISLFDPKTESRIPRH